MYKLCTHTCTNYPRTNTQTHTYEGGEGVERLHDEVIGRVTLEDVQERVDDHQTKGRGLAGQERVLKTLKRLKVLHS